MRASRMASVSDRFFIFSGPASHLSACRTDEGRASAHTSQQPTMADLRIDGRLEETQSAGQRH